MTEENIRTLTPEQLREVQLKMLEIFLYYKKFCEDHNLMFFIFGGSCIGAIRHEGFIPWDDDIDVAMPRPDYERFKICWEKDGDKKHYTYCRTNREKNYHHSAASLRDNYTTFINRHSVNEDICHGFALEIVPFDGYPKSKISRCWQLLNAFAFNLYNFQRLPDNKGGVIRKLSQLMLAIVPSKRIRDDIWIFAEKQMTKYKWDDCDYVTELIGSTFKSIFYKHPKKYFDHVVYKKFEGYDVPLMAGYKYYLQNGFGDYMKLPPKEKRVPKLDTVLISTTEPYKKYKGIYYCVDTSVKKEKKKDMHYLLAVGVLGGIVVGMMYLVLKKVLKK